MRAFAGIAIALLFIAAPAAASGPTNLWAEAYGDAYYQKPKGVAMDSGGNVIVTGYFGGMVDFGTGPLTSTNVSMFVAKIDPYGSALWSYQFGDTAYGIDVAVDTNDDIYVLCWFQGEDNFGTGVLTSNGWTDIALVKLDAGSGAVLWAQSWGSIDDDFANDVDCDGVDNVYIAGHNYAAIDFGGGSLTHAGGADVHLAKFDAAGAHLWSNAWGDADQDQYPRIAVTAGGDVALHCYFRATIQFGGALLSSAGDYDLALAYFNSGGTHQWSQSFGNGQAQIHPQVAVTSAGDVTVAATVSGAIDMGGGYLTNAGGFDIVMAQYDASGAHLWSEMFGGTGNDYARGLTIGPADVITFGGDTYASIDFGGGILVNSGGEDFLIAQFTDAGVHLASGIYGDNYDQSVTGVAVGPTGAMVMTGDLEGTADFGTGGVTSHGNTDVGLAYFAAPLLEPDHVVASLTAPAEVRVADEEIEVSFSIVNFGAASDTSTAKIVAARDTTDLGVATPVEWEPIRPLDEWPDTCRVIVSSRLPRDERGNIWIGVKADAFDSVAESDEDNNVRWVPLVYHVPVISSVTDIEGDEGGAVYLKWDSSPLDETVGTITEYSLWRTIDIYAAPSPSAEKVTWFNGSAAPSSVKGTVMRRQETATGTIYWEYVMSAPAYHLSGYAAAVPTLCDSTSVSPCQHYFQVIAHMSDPMVFYTSNMDSAWSVDDLAPAMPVNLAASQVTAPDGLELTWTPNSEADLAQYYVYRGTGDTFVPAPGNRVAAVADAGWTDPNWTWDSGWTYKVSAVDTHENESGHAAVGPGLVTDAGMTPRVTALAQNVPNPFNPVTTIAFSLAQPGDVSLVIYDSAGRAVRTLIDGRRAARHHTVTWDGRDDAGSGVASGVYFYRLVAGEVVQSRKMLLLK